MSPLTRILVAAIALLLGIEGGAWLTRAPVHAAPPTVAPPVEAQLPTRLLTVADLVHQGSFTIPDVRETTGQQLYCNYVNGQIAFNPANNSLFLVCHDWSQAVGEFAIPALGGVATVLQVQRDALEGRINQINPSDPNSKKIGGLWVAGSQLVITAYSYYDGGATAVASHFVRATNLGATGTLQGPFVVGTGYPGTHAGYFTPVPAVWQSALGGSLLNGACCHAIASLWSFGPSHGRVVLADLLAALNPSPATRLVHYPDTLAPVPYCEPTPTPFYNGTTEIGGAVFPTDTASVVFMGRHGLGPCSYAPGSGPTAPPYEPHLWFYDANDLAAVNAGTRAPHQIMPYGYGRLPAAIADPEVRGVAYDPATGRIFVTERTGSERKPRIHVLLVSGSPTPPADTTPPVVSSFTATPLTVQLGASSTLAATATDNVGVTAVDFTVNGVVAATDTAAPYEFVWTPTTTGSFDLRAAARDAAGNTGLSSTLTATVSSTAPPPPDTTPPVVSLSASPTVVAVGGDVVLTITATDNVGVTEVQFRIVDPTFTILRALTSPPYTHTWTPSVAGTYQLQGFAVDAADNRAFSTTVVVEVPSTPPPPPVDCEVSDWSAWSDWTAISATTEERTRTRTVTTAPANGGAPCPTLTETETRAIPDPDPTPPHGPAPEPDVEVTRCTITVPAFSGSPDGTGGWRMQLKYNDTNLGSADLTDPYGPRSVSVVPGSYLIWIQWRKGNKDVTQTLGTFVCP